MVTPVHRPSNFLVKGTEARGTPWRLAEFVFGLFKYSSKAMSWFVRHSDVIFPLQNFYLSAKLRDCCRTTPSMTIGLVQRRGERG